MSSNKKISKDLSNLIGLYMVAGIVAAVVAWIYLFSPTLKRTSEIQTERDEVLVKIAELEALDEATDQLRDNYEQVSAQRDQILGLLPAASQSDRLLLMLDTFSKKSGVVLETFRPETVESEDLGFAVYGSSLSLLGNYADIVDFLKRIETGARFIDITTYNIDGAESSGDPVLEVSISMNSYFQIDDSTSEDEDGEVVE